MADYEFSSAYVDSIVRGLKRSPRFAELEAKLSPAAANLIANSWSGAWQPALAFEELGEAAVATLGASTFEELTHHSMKDRFGPIVLPLIKGSMAASNKSPAAVLKKLNELVKVAMRGITVHFEAEASGNAGVLKVAYPRPVALHVGSSWMGVLRFVFEVTSPGQATDCTLQPNVGVLLFRVTW